MEQLDKKQYWLWGACFVLLLLVAYFIKKTIDLQVSALGVNLSEIYKQRIFNYENRVLSIEKKEKIYKDKIIEAQKKYNSLAKDQNLFFQVIKENVVPKLDNFNLGMYVFFYKDFLPKLSHSQQTFLQEAVKLKKGFSQGKTNTTVIIDFLEKYKFDREFSGQWQEVFRVYKEMNDGRFSVGHQVFDAPPFYFDVDEYHSMYIDRNRSYEDYREKYKYFFNLRLGFKNELALKELDILEKNKDFKNLAVKDYEFNFFG